MIEIDHRDRPRLEALKVRLAARSPASVGSVRVTTPQAVAHLLDLADEEAEEEEADALTAMDPADIQAALAALLRARMPPHKDPT